MTTERSLSRAQPADVALADVSAGAIDAYAGRRLAESYLCSLTYVEPGLADYVAEELLHDSRHAIQPPFGLDLIALARHARGARRITFWLTTVLAVNLLAAVSVAALYAWTTLGADDGRTWEQQARSLGVAGTAIILACWFVGWIALVVERSQRYLKIRALVRSPDGGRDLAPALPSTVESRLAEAMGGNVTVFRGGEPLGGHGDIIGSWSIDVDLTRAATGEDGQRKEIVPFAASEVHGAIAESIRGSGVPDLRIENRLFVRGTGVATVPGLLPLRFERPRSTLPPEMVVRGINRPTPNARTYLRVEKVAWSGDLVLNVLIRADVVADANLYVEFYACGLLPLAPFARRPEQLPKSVPEIIFRVLRDVGVTNPLRRPFGIPWYLMTQLLAHWKQVRRNLVETVRIRRGHAFDYGPVSYFREGSSDTAHYERFAEADEDMHIKIVARRTLRAIRDLLASHGIDTSDFDRLENRVSNTVYNIGNINGSGNAVGNHNRLNNHSKPSNSGDQGYGPSSGGRQ
ncbi:hypothetical protein WEI85_23680 [Actinomycetes bacterium KLBMP 9797]